MTSSDEWKSTRSPVVSRNEIQQSLEQGADPWPGQDVRSRRLDTRQHGPSWLHQLSFGWKGGGRDIKQQTYLPVSESDNVLEQQQGQDEPDSGGLQSTPLLSESPSSSSPENLVQIRGRVKGEKEAFSALQFMKFCGSGLLMSVSFLDPGNLEADIQVGVQTGYDLLWWYFICAVLFGFAFQCLAGQLGIVTGEDLAQHCGKRYPWPARILLWVLMEVAIVGADIQETIGSAIAISILSGGMLPLWAGCILISITAFLLLLLDRFGYRQLEAVFAVFIGVEAIALGINFVKAKVCASGCWLCWGIKGFRIVCGKVLQCMLCCLWHPVAPLRLDTKPVAFIEWHQL